ncbi:hypothetical protein EZV62_023400 [Acer yangbiense]|uniref:Uncharacterized protein n=1 Tax=Acer yangbiense TaxID=1000413 RepID=A0A5C7H3P0_9ROSI|nr:hypothetical protein EZV62_023400 [Acer yangbiense]
MPAAWLVCQLPSDPLPIPMSFGTASCLLIPHCPRRSSTSASVTISFTMATCGKKCYMISARELNIGDGYPWKWFSTDEAHCRFPMPDCSGKISTSHLSPMTTYVAYLVFTQHRIVHGTGAPIKATVGLVGSNNVQNRTFHFPWGFPRKQQDGDDDDCVPKERADGWFESELGEFFNRVDEDNELLMTISECEDTLLIQGIEIRPKKE